MPLRSLTLTLDWKCWYWEIVMLMQKLLLTGLLIFIRPGTTTQLAVGFCISLGFFLIHTRLQAYVEVPAPCTLPRKFAQTYPQRNRTRKTTFSPRRCSA